MKSLIRKLELTTDRAHHWLQYKRDRSHAIRELESLSDHVLQDSGIKRGNIRRIVNAAYRGGDWTVSRDVSSLGRDLSHETTTVLGARPCAETA